MFTVQAKGTITVFLALVFVSISALVLTLVESARTAGLRFHLEVASESAIDSLFSEYHNDMWDRYRIVTYECDDPETAVNSVQKYMEPYLNVGSWMRMDSAKAEINEAAYLTDTGGEWLEQEIVDYMTFGVAESLVDVSAADTLDSLWKDLNEADAIQEITNDYSEKSTEALKVEQALMDINESLDKQKELQSRAVNDLNNGSNGSFQKEADRMIGEMEKVAGTGDDDGGLVCVYENGSYDLEEELNRVDEEHADAYANIESSEGQEIIQSVKDDFLGYSSDEKNRRAEVEEIYSSTVNNIIAVKKAKEAAREIEEYADELRSAAEESEDSGEYEEEIQNLWDELAEDFSAIDIPNLDFEFGVADKNKKNFLETAKKLLGGDLLVLVLPDGKAASKAKLDLSLAPSDVCMSTDRNTENRSVFENVLIAEYIAKFFSEFTDDVDGPVRYEMEYICAGKDNDKDNLAAAVGDVLAIREGMNYLSIMRDGSKRSQARHLAEEIVIGTSGGTLTALVPVVECLIIGVWAGAESIIDCRTLLNGNKVSLVKSQEEWKLDVGSILNWGQSRKLEGSDSGDERGLSYENYLKFVILLLFGEVRNYRVMDIMQINMRTKENDFEMRNCIYGLNMNVTAKVKHLFTIIPMISRETGGFTRDFELQTNVVKAY
ncbi:MAG: DUF5702 domain-containing protein [Lachnospiraceae bacterium]|nr:DUF5702 domain-containing protein [Lachnospiraceae bacterium]